MNIYIDHDYSRLPASNDSTISVQIIREMESLPKME